MQNKLVTASYIHKDTGISGSAHAVSATLNTGEGLDLHIAAISQKINPKEDGDTPRVALISFLTGLQSRKDSKIENIISGGVVQAADSVKKFIERRGGSPCSLTAAIIHNKELFTIQIGSGKIILRESQDLVNPNEDKEKIYSTPVLLGEADTFPLDKINLNHVGTITPTQSSAVIVCQATLATNILEQDVAFNEVFENISAKHQVRAIPKKLAEWAKTNLQTDELTLASIHTQRSNYVDFFTISESLLTSSDDIATTFVPSKKNQTISTINGTVEEEVESDLASGDDLIIDDPDSSDPIEEGVEVLVPHVKAEGVTASLSSVFDEGPETDDSEFDIDDTQVMDFTGKDLLQTPPTAEPAEQPIGLPVREATTAQPKPSNGVPTSKELLIAKEAATIKTAPIQEKAFAPVQPKGDALDYSKTLLFPEGLDAAEEIEEKNLLSETLSNLNIQNGYLRGAIFSVAALLILTTGILFVWNLSAGSDSEAEPADSIALSSDQTVSEDADAATTDQDSSLDQNGGDVAVATEDSNAEAPNCVNPENSCETAEATEAPAQATSTPLPTSTNTPVPAAPTEEPVVNPGLIGRVFESFSNSGALLFPGGQVISNSIAWVVLTDQQTDSDLADEVYLLPDSSISFSDDPDSTYFNIEQGSSILMRSNDNVITGRLINSSTGQFNVNEGCMSIDYDTEAPIVSIACYNGSCSWNDTELGSVEIESGSLITFDPADFDPVLLTNPQPISEESVLNYFANLVTIPSGRFVSDACLASYLPTVVEAEATEPAALPTNTPVTLPTATPTNQPAAQQPTATQVPPTSPPPAATATSAPPTATANPPTATPLPPTATANPPTATPVPPTPTEVPPTLPPATETPEPLPPRPTTAPTTAPDG